MNTLTKDILRYNGTFRNRNMEEEFLLERWPGYSKRIRILILLTGLAYLSGIHGDYLSFNTNNSFLTLLTMRIITFLTALFAFAVTFSKNGHKINQSAIFLYVIFIAITECIELGLKPELGKQALPFIILIMISYALFFNASLKYIVLFNILATIGYLYTLLHFTTISANILSPIITTFILIIALSVYFTWYFYKTQRSTFYTLKEYKRINYELKNEIRERKKAQKKLHRISITDELTNIYNRRYFKEQANRDIKRALRADRDLSLLFLDIDFFKKINDTYGHDAGDLVLIKLSEAIQKNIRDEDVFARWGGEEFAILLPETEIENANIVAERIRKMTEKTSVRYQRKKITFTVSIGISNLKNTDRSDLTELIKNADTALYKAKKDGRNRVIKWGK